MKYINKSIGWRAGLIALAVSALCVESGRGSVVSSWTFDEASSGTATAVDGTDGNNGVFFGGAVRTGGLIGVGAAAFSGVSGQSVHVNTNGYSTTTGISVEALIDWNWDGVSGTPFQQIFRKEDGGNRILFSFQAGNILAFGLNVGGSYAELDMPLDGLSGRPSFAEMTNGMHHVVATYSSWTGLKGIYVDGTLRFSTSYTPGSLITSGGTVPAAIGNSCVGCGEPFVGVIDEVAIYNEPLGASTIADHYSLVQRGISYIPEPTSALLILAAGWMIGRLHRRS